MLKEFKNFIMTGNVLDLAIGVIMAGAIGAVVNGFVSNIMMPVVGYLSNGMDFSKMKHVLTPEVKDAASAITTPENAITYGAWITTIINLIVVGFVMFLIVKAYNKSKAAEPEAAPAGPSEIDLLTEIRDSLKK
jgi:large conductance mechanosensitive channel